MSFFEDPLNTLIERERRVKIREADKGEIMSVSNIPEKVKIRLWGRAAGRCQYEGCNKPLWRDDLTKAEFNTAYIAHIVADQPNGPRGDDVLSKDLAADISNLMLMCDEHHRLIDREDIKGHPTERLQGMKRIHEERIEMLSALQPEMKSHVLLYGANIGKHNVPLSWEKATQAMLPDWYPVQKPAIELSLKNSSFQDHEDEYWQIEQVHLQRQFDLAVRPRLASGDINHFSIFALAPQPLLISLGRLLSDIPAAEVYQLHREPPDWIWKEALPGFKYSISEPPEEHQSVAINLSLSAIIDNARVKTVLGDDVSIWTLSIAEPQNDFMKSRLQLSLFRKTFRQLLNRIKAAYGEDKVIHVFPAVPVSVAVEIGRVWMPKADLPMRIYDQNRQSGGFGVGLDICQEQGE